MGDSNNRPNYRRVQSCLSCRHKVVVHLENIDPDMVCAKNSIIPYNIEQDKFEEWVGYNRINTIFVCDNWRE